MELESSEAQRNELKNDLEDSNNKIIQMEEEMYESKQVQLDLLEQLNELNAKFDEYVQEWNEDKFQQLLEQSSTDYQKKLQYAQQKIAELHNIVGSLEHTQVIYIAHKTDKIDQCLANFINRFPERNRMQIMFLRESEGVYQFGQKRIYVKVEKGDKILVRVGGGYMGIEEFINQYTPEEVEKVQRKDVFAKFQNKMKVQYISANQSIAARETSPIRSPQRVRGPSPDYSSAARKHGWQ